MYHLRVPVTEQELKEYYQFRWEMLRKPLHQPVGSEKDAYDAMAHHQMVVDEAGKIVAIGRLYINADNEAAIRFLAVDPTLQDKGLGTLVAITLESVARQEGVKRVVCSAREDAVDFFAKLGFVNQGEITAPQTTPIRHFLMIKPVATLDDILHRPDWCGQLQQARYEHIPLSEKMGVRISQYTGQRFVTTMPEIGNQNPHHTLFAGSLFSLATLTAGADLAAAARAPSRRHHHSGGRAHSLQQTDHRQAAGGGGSRLAERRFGASGARRRARVHAEVHLFGDEDKGAVFEGTYMVLPAEPDVPLDQGGSEALEE